MPVAWSLILVDHFNAQVLIDAYTCLSVTVFVTIPVKSTIFNVFNNYSLLLTKPVYYSDIIEMIYKT